MKDINNVEMKTGDIVEIKKAYFKNDNGIYFVAHTPEDVSWCGNDYSLRKMCKNGKISTNSKNIAFWPLSAFTNNSQKNTECRVWNKEHATIEVLYNIDNSKVVERFKEEAEITKQQAEREARYYGEDTKSFILSNDIYNLYIDVIARIEAVQQVETVIETIKQEEQVETIQQEPQIITSDPEPILEIAPEPQAEQTVTTIERTYFPINERVAKTAKEINSHDSYIVNSATNSYINAVDEVYIIADTVAIKHPEQSEQAYILATRYAKQYAEWLNTYYSIEASCPSVLVCGAGNFPVKKKEKQNQRRHSHYKKLAAIESIIDKIKNIGKQSGVIRSGDADVIEKLENKIADLEKLQQTMKEANNYYKKNKTLQGFEGLNQKNINDIMEFMSRNTYHTRPFESYSLTNNNANIKATKARLESIQKAKQQAPEETKEILNEYFKVVENAEIMRLQLIFEGKPDEAVRTILKSNGFKWAPSQSAWQRQLTENAKYSLKRVTEQLQQLKTA